MEISSTESSMKGMIPSRKKNRCLTLVDKVHIIKGIEKGVRQTDMAKLINIPKSTINSILKNKEKTMAAFNQGNLDHFRRIRPSAFPELERSLLIWIRQNESNLTLDKQVVLSKAEEIAREMGLNFRGSDSWLARFKQRNFSQPSHNLTSIRELPTVVSSESVVLDPVVQMEPVGVQQQVPTVSELMPKDNPIHNAHKNLEYLLQKYEPRDIFNVDEISLLWNLLPDNVLNLQSDISKLNKDRITIVLGTNMDGSEKLCPLVIGKVKHPSAFEQIKTFPIQYEANPKACITKEIFKNLIQKQDSRFQSENRRVLFIVDNCSSHKTIPVLKAIHLISIPRCNGRSTQPIEYGVSRSLKHHYRKKLMQSILLHLNSENEYDWDFLKAMYNVSYAWNEVHPDVIRDSFHLAGLGTATECGPLVEDSSHVTNQLINNLRGKGMDIPIEVTGDLYETIDSNLECCSTLNNEELVDFLNRGDNADELQIDRKFPTVVSAAKSLDILRIYFSSLEESDKALKVITELEHHLFQSKHALGFTNYNTASNFGGESY